MYDIPSLPRRATAKPEPRILLQPIAAPSTLGYFALASALIVWGSWFAGGWGTEQDPASFFPFVILFGGVGQLGAALWSYHARGAVSAALHGSWAAFFLGLGLIYLLATTHTIVVPSRGMEWSSLGQWFIYMAVVTWTTAFAALARHPEGFVAQAVLAAGATIAAAALLAGSPDWQEAAGWVFVAAATLCFLAGAATMVRQAPEPVAYERGDPGVKVGQ